MVKSAAWFLLFGASLCLSLVVVQGGGCEGEGLFAGTGTFTGVGEFIGGDATFQGKNSTFQSTSMGTFEGDGMCDGKATFKSINGGNITVIGSGVFEAEGEFKSPGGVSLFIKDGKVMGQEIIFTGTGTFEGQGMATGKMKVFGDTFFCEGSGSLYGSGIMTGEGSMSTDAGTFEGEGTFDGTGTLEGTGSCEADSTAIFIPTGPSGIGPEAEDGTEEEDTASALDDME